MDDLATNAELAREISTLKKKLSVAEATLAAEISGKATLHEQVEALESTIASFYSISSAFHVESMAKIEAAKKPNATPRKPEFVLSKDYDNEWVAGPFDSAEEARAEIGLYDEDDKIRVHRVKYMSVGDWMPTVSDLLETMDMHAHDNGYSIDDPTHVITSEPAAQRALERWAERWIHLENEKWVGDEVA